MQERAGKNRMASEIRQAVFLMVNISLQVFMD